MNNTNNNAIGWINHGTLVINHYRNGFLISLCIHTSQKVFPWTELQLHVVEVEGLSQIGLVQVPKQLTTVLIGHTGYNRLPFSSEAFGLVKNSTILGVDKVQGCLALSPLAVFP